MLIFLNFGYALQLISKRKKGSDNSDPLPPWNLWFSVNGP